MDVTFFSSIGAVANVNAAADTVVSTVTLGQYNAGEVIGVPDWMHSDYGASYAFARGGYELLTGVGTAGLASLKGAGTGLRVAGNAARFYDAAGNAVTFAEGATGVYNDGLNWKNGAHLAGGALGLRGNFADFSLVRDPSVVGTAFGNLRIHKNSNAYVGDTHVYGITGPADLYPGGVYKVGQSATGVRVGDRASIRAEVQARRLTRTTGRLHETYIDQVLPDKISAKAYERERRDRLRGQHGPGSLPGNRERS